MGGTVVDKAGTSYPGIYFSPESNLVRQYKEGTTTNYWDQILQLYAPGATNSNVLSRFPADKMQFAPKDWGKP